jgi:hypothetical protein
VDANRHNDWHSCDSHYYLDAVDHYSNHYQYAHADIYPNLYPNIHFEHHYNGYLYANFYLITDLDTLQHQFADDHVYALVSSSTYVHPDTVHYPIPITDDTLTLT